MSHAKENPCKNFAPNVFNKNKCQNCFKSRDSHLKSDKDLNKAKPIYGGWLLLAPIGTDFGNPAQRNRKWQRRWFVLFQHGALRYALDNNETTVAQGTIDMNKCNDVAYAESMTDQKYSLCIYLTDQNYYIRGECREDIMGWYDQLIVYPQTNKEEMKRKKRWKHRQTETPNIPPQTADELPKRQISSPSLLRSRNSSSSSTRSSIVEKNDLSSKKTLKRSDDLILSSSDRTTRAGLISPPEKNNDINATDSNSSKLDMSYFTSERKSSDQNKEKTDSYCAANDKLQRNISVSTSSLDSTASNYSLTDGIDATHGLKKKHNLVDFPKSKRQSNLYKELRKTDTSNKENDEPSLLITDSSHGDRSGSPTIGVTSPVTSPLTTPRDSDREDKRGRSISRRPTNKKQGTQTEYQNKSELRRAKSLDRSAYDLVHLATDLFNIKKGWLQKRGEDGQWHKNWFVLVHNELNFYRDSSSEDSSAPAGTVSLSNFIEVNECEVQRHYGFQIKTANETHTFSAMTSGIRRNWINAIRKSCQESAEDAFFVPAPVEETAQETAKDVNVSAPSPPPQASDASELSTAERAQRRKERFRERKKEKRSRTFDFAEFRPSMSQALNVDPVHSQLGKSGKSETKARSRTLDPDSLLVDTKTKRSYDDIDGSRKKDGIAMENFSFAPKPSNVRMSIETEWQKVEKANFLNVDLSPSPISKTASMVKALQSEIDSLKKQMDRVQSEQKNEDYRENETTADGFAYPESDINSMLDQKNIHIEKLKQELSNAQDAFRKQSSDLRDREMRLDINLSESQVMEAQLSNIQNELRLEKSRREEAEKEHSRKMNTLNKELEDSESQLKKTETSHLNAQRKIRELERMVHMQKGHDKEKDLLQDHIGVLRKQAEDQEHEMREMQESFEEKCQQQKKLEDRLSEAKDLIKTYEEQVHELRQKTKTASRDADLNTAHRSNAQRQIQILMDDLEVSRRNEEKLKEKIQKLIAQSEIDEDCNKSLQGDLNKEKAANQRLRLILKEHDEDYTANDKQLAKTTEALEQLSNRFNEADEARKMLQIKCKDLGVENKKLKDDVAKLSQSEQTIRDLRARLSTAEKQLRDIEEIRSSTSTESSITAKLSELETEMVGMGQVITARLQSLEPSRRISDPSLILEKETPTHRIHRLEHDLEKKVKELEISEERTKACENKIAELESREKETSAQFTAKLKDSHAAQELTTKTLESKVADLELSWKDAAGRLLEIQRCLSALHDRVTSMKDADRSTGLLQTVISDIMKLSLGDAQISDTPPRSPSPAANLPEKKWSRITDEESRQNNIRAMNRLRQLTERLKNSDGKLISPTASPHQEAKVGNAESSARPKDLIISNPSNLSETDAEQLFAKQIGIQAILLAGMAATLQRSQTPSGPVTPSSRSRQPSPSPLTAAEFSDKMPFGVGSFLLEHADTLAQKLALEGLLMREISRLKESWSANRARSAGHRSLNATAQPNSELCSAVVAHAHISYVLQVYNERISRLSLEAKQARHRADAALKKLKELVQACKTQDLEAISTLAVQVDTDTIAPPYSDKPQWEQQVDYGTLHGAHSTSSTSSEASHLDQESLFFHQLADDLRCMSVDVQSLSKLGARLVQADTALEKCLLPSEIGEHPSAVAREAIVQAEIIYISHRLRRDYDEELRKAKDAVSEQSKHFEQFKSKAKRSDETWAAKFKQASEDHKAELTKWKQQNEESWNNKLKQKTDEHNAMVKRWQQEVEKLEKTRAQMSNDMDKTLTRLSKKHDHEVKECNDKHEQEVISLKKELSRVKNELELNAKNHLAEVKKLKEKLGEYEVERRKNLDAAYEQYMTELEKAQAQYARDHEAANQLHQTEVGDLKSYYEKELNETEKEFSDKLRSIESAKKDELNAQREQQRLKEKTLNEDHRKKLVEAERDSKSKLEAFKRDFDERLKQERLTHQMGLRTARDDAEKEAQEKMMKKIQELKKESEKLLERRDRLHKEQLEREKEEWTKEYKQQLDAQHEVAHSRSASEAESKETLKAQISMLENQLVSVQGKLEDEQQRHDYQSQLNEIKTLCDASFAEIEESHAKQLNDLVLSHKRELEKLSEEHDIELNTNDEDTRRVIDAMRKHHMNELRDLREEVRSGSNRNEPADFIKLKKEIDTLSEHYSKKCVELANAVKQNEKTEDALKSLEREVALLRSRKPMSSESCAQSQVRRLSGSADEDQTAADLYQMEVMLRVKVSEVDYLKQDVSSLNKQMDEMYQEIKLLQKKHKSLFDELTLSRSKEGMARREAARFKEQLRHHGLYSDDDLDSEVDSRSASPSGYDFQKSRSQPDFPSTALKPSTFETSSTTSSTAAVKRRSSDRSSRHVRIR